MKRNPLNNQSVNPSSLICLKHLYILNTFYDISENDITLWLLICCLL